MQTDTQDRATFALLGYSVPAIEAMQKLERKFVCVVPEGFESELEPFGIPFVIWDFYRHNDRSRELAVRLGDMGASVAVPLFEECVEWAGALNGYFRDDPRLFVRYMLFRDKGMMKRRAQMHGIRVGAFEECDDRPSVLRFFERVNRASSKIDGDEAELVHLKPLAAAGSLGHKLLRNKETIDNLPDDAFPCLVETHLDGQEFSCEVFVHKGRIRFLNITEYVHLGHSNFVPASSVLQDQRGLIERAVQDLIDAFSIEYGMIHPEFFINPQGRISFGEVAARVPGGHIFELIHRAYGFDPFAGFALCCDPRTTDEELEAFFPSWREHDEYAGSLMVYPRVRRVSHVEVPKQLLEHPYYEKHNLFMPITAKVAERVAYGDHYGTVFFHGGDPHKMRDLLLEYEHVDFYHESAPESDEQVLPEHSEPPDIGLAPESTPE